MVPVSSRKWARNTTNALFGKSFSLGKTISKYYHHRYTFMDSICEIYVFQMPEKLIDYITENIDHIMENYPIRPWVYLNKFSKNYPSKGWQKTPFNEEERIYYDFAFSLRGGYLHSAYAEKNAKRSSAYFEELMNEEGSYYCYAYSDYGTRGNIFDEVYFYVFNLEKKMLIIIYIDEVTY
jgi:hypothetical protein